MKYDQHCSMLLAEFNYVVHDTANIEIIQSKFIDCMWLQKTPSNIMYQFGTEDNLQFILYAVGPITWCS